MLFLLREFIRQAISTSSSIYDEAYDKKITDDPDFDKESKIISNDRKKKIKKFLGDMKM